MADFRAPLGTLGIDRAHMELAIPALQAMHTRPALERALRLRQPAAVAPLPARERDVAALIAAGFGNRAIADALVITEAPRKST